MTGAEVSVVILVISMLLYITEIVPVAITALGSCAALAALNVVPSYVVWEGFSSDTILVVGGMMVVGISLIETGVAKSTGDFVLKKLKHKPEVAAYAVIIIAMLLSGFMNNSASVATMLPVMAGIVVSSNGELHEKFLFLPLAAGTNAGGMLTLIGTTAQMVIQTTIEENGLKPFGFFEFAWIGVPVVIAFIIYMLTIGKWLGKRIWDSNQPHTEYVNFLSTNNENPCQENQVQCPVGKQVISILILVAAIICMFCELSIPNGTIAMIAACLSVITGCISLKEIYKKVDWTTIFVLAGGIGFAKGLDISGGGMLIANTIVQSFGAMMTPYTVFIMFTVTSAILTLFMSNTAVTAMLAPIAMAFSSKIGVNPVPVLLGIAMASNCAFSTPIATPSMTMVLGPGEYRFMDYVKWCLGFNIIAVMLIILIIPKVWAL